MATVCVKAIVSGKVQGVFFRASAQKQAQQLKLTGWVKNTAAGTVELLACGDNNAIAAFKLWLSQGPDLADVTHVDCTDIAVQSHENFIIER